MKWLTNFKSFIFALFFTTIGVISWGQTPIDLSDCTIGGVQTVYGYSSGTFDISFTVVDDDDNVIPSDHYAYVITKNGATSDVNGIGDYTLTISGVSPYTTGTLSKDFFVMAGAGTAVNPYTIETTAEWNTFANAVANGYTFNNEYVKLKANININKMVGIEGYSYYPFCGTFDGDNKTLTIGLSGDSEIAPFYWTDGATIKKLLVAGSITATGGYAAGLIYSNTTENGNTTVQNVTVSATISASGQEYCAGFAVYSLGLVFDNCVFDGSIVAGNYSCGFSASYDYAGYYTGPATFTNCIFDPADGSVITSGYTFAKNIESDETCYYTSAAGTEAQGVEAYLNTVPSGHIGHYEKKLHI